MAENLASCARARGFDKGEANLGFLAREFVGVLNEFKILKFVGL